MSKLFDFEGGEEYGKLFKSMFDLPIFPDNDLNIESAQPEHRELLEQFKGVRTINDALKKLQGVGQMLDSDTNFKKYKNLLSTYVNRSAYSYNEWEFEFDEKMKDTAFGKSFSEMVDLSMVESDKNDEYTSFIYTYVQLEFFGVTEERTGKKNKLKKNSHLDLNKDAAHAFFASKADYFVTDDIGVQTKAFIVYKLFNIQTKVLSIQDFIARSMLLLKNEDTTASFYGGLSFSLKKRIYD